MKEILMKVIHSIVGFFDRIIVKEVERIFQTDNQVLGDRLNSKGGGRLK